MLHKNKKSHADACSLVKELKYYPVPGTMFQIIGDSHCPLQAILFNFPLVSRKSVLKPYSVQRVAINQDEQRKFEGITEEKIEYE